MGSTSNHSICLRPPLRFSSTVLAVQQTMLVEYLDYVQLVEAFA